MNHRLPVGTNRTQVPNRIHLGLGTDLNEEPKMVYMNEPLSVSQAESSESLTSMNQPFCLCPFMIAGDPVAERRQSVARPEAHALDRDPVARPLH